MVYSIYDETFSKPFRKGFPEKLRFDTIGDEEIADIAKREPIDFVELSKIAVDYSDGVIQGSKQINENISKYITDQKVNFLDYEENFDENVTRIEQFYEKILS